MRAGLHGHCNQRFADNGTVCGFLAKQLDSRRPVPSPTSPRLRLTRRSVSRPIRAKCASWGDQEGSFNLTDFRSNCPVAPGRGQRQRITPRGDEASPVRRLTLCARRHSASSRKPWRGAQDRRSTDILYAILVCTSLAIASDARVLMPRLSGCSRLQPLGHPAPLGGGLSDQHRVSVLKATVTGVFLHDVGNSSR